jgi:hypothetical protein
MLPLGSPTAPVWIGHHTLDVHTSSDTCARDFGNRHRARVDFRVQLHNDLQVRRGVQRNSDILRVRVPLHWAHSCPSSPAR